MNKHSMVKTAGLALISACILAVSGPIRAEEPPLRIGVLTDLTGPYSATNGRGDVIAAEMAAADFGGTVLGRRIEVISGDHLNKADVASSIARSWFERENVSAIVGVPNSAVALAVNTVAAERGRILLATGPATTELTGKACAPTTFQWTYNTWMLSHVTANAVVKGGGKRWFFLTADYAFGRSMEQDATAVVRGAGGEVIGAVRVPLNSADLSSQLLQAQASKADIIGLALAGTDIVNAVKQANEFGLVSSGQKLAALLALTTDVVAMGAENTSGLLFSETFYWDTNDATRHWGKAFGERNGGKIPNMVNAGAYSAVTHYLKAIKAAGTVDGPVVAAKMRELPLDDVVFGHGTVRIDGQAVHPAYLLEGRGGKGGNGPWDIATIKAVIPAEDAFAPLSASECPAARRP